MLACACAAFLPLRAPAQALTGSIEGAVRDERGAVVAGAEFTATQNDTNLTRRVVSNASGFFRLEQLPIGGYRLLGAKSGFRQVSAEVQVTLGSPVTVNVELPVGAANEVVIVSAGAAQVELSSAEISRNLPGKTINDLPALSRNPAELLQLFPGAPAMTQDKNGSFTVGGLRPRSTTYNVDGSNNNFEVSSGPRTPVVQEAVQEFRALTNVFSAQYGKGAGAVIDMVLKSGGNQFHGDLFEYHRNTAIDATPFFANAANLGKPPFILNLYGATLGGPLRKDKTFFFASFQGTNQRTSAVERLTVPSDQVRSPIVNDPRSLAADPKVAQLITGVFAQLPPCAGAGVSCVYSSPQSRPADEYVGSVKIDHRFNDNNALTGRFLYRDLDQLSNSALLPNVGETINRDLNLAVTYRRVFNPSMVNEAVFSYSRFRRDIDVPNATLPDVAISGFSNIVGGSANLPQAFTNDYYGLLDNLSIIKGAHTIKAGFDVLRASTVGFAFFSGRGVYQFQALPANLGAADALTNFRLGRAASFTKTSGDYDRGYDSWDTSFYLQDDWKVSPRLTLNLGARYEIQFPPHVYGLKDGTAGFAAFDPTSGTFVDWRTDKNNLSPALGLAWDPTGKGNMSIRAGYRVAYDRIVLDYYDIGGALQPPFINSFSAQLPQVTAIPFGQGESAASAAGLPISLMMLPDVHTPYAGSWHVTAQRKLGKDASVEVGYLGTSGRALGIPVVFNRIDPVTKKRPDARFGSITLVDDTGYSNYHGLTGMVRRRASDRLFLTAAYTWSKAMDVTHDAVAPFGGESGGAAAVATDANGNPRLDLEYGPAIFDRPHAFSSGFSWQSPRFTRVKALGPVIGDWQVSGVILLQSGNPFSVFAGADLNQDGVNNDRPDLLQTGLLGKVYSDPNQAIPRSAFYGALSTAGGFRVGTLGRNTFRRDGIRSVDLALVKNFRVTERQRLEFRGEFFNLFNRPQFDAPVNTLSSASFGSIQSQLNNPRFVRFALKYHF
jgi:hypothetical protein